MALEVLVYGTSNVCEEAVKAEVQEIVEASSATLEKGLNKLVTW